MTGRLNCVDSSGKKNSKRPYIWHINICILFWHFLQLCSTWNSKQGICWVFWVNVISYWHSQDTLNTATFKIYRNTLKNPVNNYYLLKETTSDPYAHTRPSNFNAHKLAYQRNGWSQRRRVTSRLNTQTSPCSAVNHFLVPGSGSLAQESRHLPRS